MITAMLKLLNSYALVTNITFFNSANPARHWQILTVSNSRIWPISHAPHEVANASRRSPRMTAHGWLLSEVGTGSRSHRMYAGGSLATTWLMSSTSRCSCARQTQRSCIRLQSIHFCSFPASDPVAGDMRQSKTIKLTFQTANMC